MKIIFSMVRKMIKEKGLSTILIIGFLFGSLAVGYAFKKYTDHVDHPIEQIAEDILDDYGIEIDFSEEKKED